MNSTVAVFDAQALGVGVGADLFLFHHNFHHDFFGGGGRDDGYGGDTDSRVFSAAAAFCRISGVEKEVGASAERPSSPL
jgi:hypothetical protein